MDVEEYTAAVDRALDGMLAVANELGPDRVNERAALPGANSAFVLLTHCLGVCDYWLGALVAGRDVDRDREAEFEAAGSLSQLAAAVDAGRARIRADLAAYRPAAPLAVVPDARFQGPDKHLNTDGVLLHVLEELAQHHGQLEVLRDVLVHGSTPADAAPQDAR
jgi:hypothetical protein